MGGRLLLLDNDGKVQFDTFARLQGCRLELPEVLSVLTGHESSAYGVHLLPSDEQAGDGSAHVAYCAAQLTGSDGRLGCLLYVSTVQELMESLTDVRRQLITIFMVVAAVALTVALIFSQVLTRPIISLTRSIQKMGKGDLSVRVKVKGSSELRDLARSYNAMAEQLEALDKSRNQFVSNASHELKTPLATMKILLENLLYDPDMPAEIRSDFIKDLNHEIDRLTAIVTDLLTLTRMDGKRMELHPESLDLSELTAESVRLLQPNADQRHHALVTRIVPGIIIRGDKSKLGQVIYNLTENAIKYTPDGGRIAVTLIQRGKLAVLSVQDNGVGIPKEDIAHIFDRFYRVDKARSREAGGSGLGLSIVRQLVELHGGRVTVESQFGHGSTFTVELPMDTKEVAQDAT